jgi:hypothetical protein
VATDQRRVGGGECQAVHTAPASQRQTRGRRRCRPPRSPRQRQA